MNPEGLDRALHGLRPYLGDLVLCGAWAWYLYRRCLASPGWMPVEFTRDLDCIGPERLPVRNETVFARMDSAEFVWAPRGDDPPPSSFAWPSVERPEVEVQFLVPARGDGARRVLELQPNLFGEALRHLDILLDRPLDIVIDDASPAATDLTFRGLLRVPRIGHFAIQKSLIRERRTTDKQATDSFQVFDLLDGANGLAETVLRDVVAARPAWHAEVDLFVAHLQEQVHSPRLLRSIAERYAEERRPRIAYIEREMSEWLDRLGTTPQVASGGPSR